MKIVISFVGGSRDGSVIAGDSNEPSYDTTEVAMLCMRTKHGTVGKQAALEAQSGQDVYEVTEKLERSNSIIVRLRHVAHTIDPGELMSLLG